MRATSLVKNVLGVEHTVVESVSASGKKILVRVRPTARFGLRCPECHRKCPRYDRGSGRRRWRSMDCGPVRVYLEAEAPRIKCKGHGVRVAEVPWARPRSRYTYPFEDEVAWLAAQAPKTAVCALQRITWRSVGRVIQRVVAAALEGRDGLDGLRRISIDEKSYRKGHRYLTVVTNLDTSELVWAAEARTASVVHEFFDALGPERSAQLEVVARDAAKWLSEPVKARAPQAVQCMDPFHVVKWMTEAVDKERRELIAGAKMWGLVGPAQDLKKTMWVLRKGRENLRDHEKERLAALVKTNGSLYRAYILRELLRKVFHIAGDDGLKLLHKWLIWARRCQIRHVVEVAKGIATHIREIEAALLLGVSTSRSEALNAKIQVIIRRSYGFHSAEAVIALAFLCLGGVCPQLPHR